MKLQAYLSSVNAIIDACTNDASVAYVRNELEQLRATLEDHLRSELAASAGRLSAVSAVKAMLKAAGAGGRKALAFPWIDGDGRQCICDGFQAYRLRNHLPLPERPENLGDGIDLDKVMTTPQSYSKTLPMPSVSELRACIALWRANRPKRRKTICGNDGPQWDFGPEAPTVDARLLLNAAILFPAVTELRWNNTVSALYFACDDGDGCVLPLRVANKPVAAKPVADANPAAPAAAPADHSAQPAPETPAAEPVAAKPVAAKPAAPAAAPADHSAQPAPETPAAKPAEDPFEAARDHWRKVLGEAIDAKENALKAYRRRRTDANAEAYYAACKNVGEQVLASYRARLAFNADYAIAPQTVTTIVRNLYARDFAIA